jgi:hypothetical protein
MFLDDGNPKTTVKQLMRGLSYRCLMEIIFIHYNELCFMRRQIKKHVRQIFTFSAICLSISTVHATNTVDVEINSDLMHLNNSSGTCPAGFILMSPDKARTIAHSIPMGGYQWAQLADGYVMGGAGWGHDIKPGKASTAICINHTIVIERNGGKCPSNTKLMSLETAQNNRENVGEKLHLWEWAELSDGYVMGGSGYKYDIKPGSSLRKICDSSTILNSGPEKISSSDMDASINELNSSELITDLSSVWISDYSVTPTGIGASSNRIFANGYMQSEVIVRVELRDTHDGELITTPITELNSAVDSEGNSIDFIRLYSTYSDIGYDPNKPMEIGIDEKSFGENSQYWKASRQSNKYEKRLPNVFNAQEVDSQIALEEYTVDNGWHTFRYWVTTEQVTSLNVDMNICARIGNETGFPNPDIYPEDYSTNLKDSCANLDTMPSSYSTITAIPPPVFSKNDFIESSYPLLAKENVYLTKINISAPPPYKFVDLYIEALPLNSDNADQTRVENMSLIGSESHNTYADPLGGTSFEGYALLAMNQYGTENSKNIALRGWDAWNERESIYSNDILLEPNSHHISLLSMAYSIKRPFHYYVGWVLDPLRTVDGYRPRYTTPMQLGDLSARDQYGNGYVINFSRLSGGFDVTDIRTASITP